jgi:hypothetical protein
VIGVFGAFCWHVGRASVPRAFAPRVCPLNNLECRSIADCE